MAELGVILLKYKGMMESVARKSAVELGARIKDKTPVGETGNARASWSDNGRLKLGKPYLYTSKGVDYVQYLEYGNKYTAPRGHSEQAPHGMVRINTIKWPSIVAKYAKSA